MTYSIYNFLRNTKEKTKALDQMASYIHHNTDMKVYLFLTLENYAEFEVYKSIIMGVSYGLSMLLAPAPLRLWTLIRLTGLWNSMAKMLILILVARSTPQIFRLMV